MVSYVVEDEEILIHEGLRVSVETPGERRRREAAINLRRAVMIARMAIPVAIIQIIALINLDIALPWFDGFVDAEAFAPSNWLSRGDGLMAVALVLLVCMTRRHGGDLAAKAHGLAWLIGVVITSWFLFSIMHDLTAEDMPSSRFVAAYLCSWYLAQAVAIQIYDLKRGGIWWQAPFFAGLFGFGVQSVVYFFAAFYGTEALHWVSWLVIDFAIKMGFVVVCLPIYWLLRPVIRPYMGYGGY